MTNVSFPGIGLAPAWVTAAMQASAKAFTIAVTAQQVIALRVSMIAVDGNTSRNRREMERMVTEKVAAVQESSGVLLKLASTMSQAWPTMFVDAKAAERMLLKAAKASDRALTPFSRRVTANQKRLTR